METCKPALNTIRLWGRRVGIAPALLALAFLLPPPRGASIAGLPSLCGFHRLTGLPCPGCGITRSVVCCAHGLWPEAFAYHPLGPAVFAALILLSLLRLTGGRIAPPRRLVEGGAWLGGAILIALWGARLAGWLPAPP